MVHKKEIIAEGFPADFIRRVSIDEIYESEEYGTTTMYFIAPVELLNGKYPEAVSAEISIEFPTDSPEAKDASVMLSPTEEVEGGYSDCDWFDMDLPLDVIEKLISKGFSDIKGRRRIRRICYDLYKLDWLERIPLERKRKAYLSFAEEDFPDPDFPTYIEENGFQGELYVCYPEFLQAEYTDAEFMEKLLEGRADLIQIYKEDRG